MEALIGFLVLLIFSVLPLSLGIFGWRTEKKHFAQLDEEEKQYANILVSDMKYLPPNWNASDPRLVQGSVVIANDILKTFLASWIQIFGGRIRAYETLVERARREAVVRMLRQAATNGSNVVWNVRISTTTLQSSNNEQQGAAGVEAIAYGTAMRVTAKS